MDMFMGCLSKKIRRRVRMKLRNGSSDGDYKGRINWIDKYKMVSKEEFDRDIEEWKKKQEQLKKEENRNKQGQDIQNH